MKTIIQEDNTSSGIECASLTIPIEVAEPEKLSPKSILCRRYSSDSPVSVCASPSNGVKKAVRFSPSMVKVHEFTIPEEDSRVLSSAFLRLRAESNSFGHIDLAKKCKVRIREETRIKQESISSATPPPPPVLRTFEESPYFSTFRKNSQDSESSLWEARSMCL